MAADKGDLNSPCLKATLVSQAAEEPVVGSLHQAMMPTTVTAGPHLIVMLQTLPLSASECHHSEKGSRSVRHGALRHRRQVDARAHASPLPFGDHRTSVWSPKKRPRELDRHTTRSPPTARWSTSAWPSSSPGLHSRGRSPRTRVVDRLGSRSSWLWTLFTRTHRLIDAERRPHRDPKLVWRNGGPLNSSHGASRSTRSPSMCPREFALRR
jgi:hypothetical protein